MESLSTIFDQYFPMLYSYVEKKVGDRFAASDIVTDVIMKTVRTYPDLPDHKVKVTLLVCARNACYDWIKHQVVVKKEQDSYEYYTGSDYAESERAEIRADLLVYMDSCIEKLPPVCKQVFRFSYQGLKEAEIANRLKIAGKTVRNQLNIARKILRSQVRGYSETDL